MSRKANFAKAVVVDHVANPNVRTLYQSIFFAYMSYIDTPIARNNNVNKLNSCISHRRSHVGISIIVDFVTRKTNYIVIVLLVLITQLTCSYHWQATPTGVADYLQCDKTKITLQMIKVPNFTNMWFITYDCDCYAREKISIAATIFYVKWLLEFGDHDHAVFNALNTLLITFDDEVKRFSGYDINGNSFEGYASGLALTPGSIWVKATRDELLCETSLVHEFVHVAIWAIKKTDGDPDHEGKKYAGWHVDHTALIQDVNTALCTLGL